MWYEQLGEKKGVRFEEVWGEEDCSKVEMFKGYALQSTSAQVTRAQVHQIGDRMIR